MRALVEKASQFWKSAFEEKKKKKVAAIRGVDKAVIISTTAPERFDYFFRFVLVVGAFLKTV